MREYLLVIPVSFILNFTWEYLQLPLYTDYSELGSGWQLLLWASLGDVFYTLLIVGLIAAIARRDWFSKPNGHEYVLAAILGFIVALLVEYKAFLLRRWAYSTFMPIIPILHIGISPLIQLTLLVPLSAFIANLLSRFMRLDTLAD